jgi:hypothetical protein
MNTKLTLLIIAIIITAILSLTTFNAFNIKRTFTVYSLKNSSVCFLVSSEMQIELTKSGFKYRGGENHGHVEILNQSLSKNFTKASINEFEAAYHKTVNFRHFEYKVDEKRIIKDTFTFIKKLPTHLIPYKSNCDKFIKHHKSHIIF